jgi:hypothetical protein
LLAYTEFRDLVAEVKSEKIPEAAKDTAPINSEVVRRPTPPTIPNSRSESRELDATVPYTTALNVPVPKSNPVNVPTESAPKSQFDWRFWVSILAIAIGFSVLIMLFLPKLLK